MITISLCMIARDEEAVLGRCLASAQGIADEIILVDTGSADATKDIAAAFGAQVYDFQWKDDFAAARNAAFDHATQEYILWLDADDVIDEDNRQRLLSLKQSLDPTVDVVMMRYHIAFDQKNQPTYTFYRERLLRRAAGMRWQGRVHEAIVPTGSVVWDETAICHRKMAPRDPGRNLRIYQSMLAAGEPFTPRDRFYCAREMAAMGELIEAIELLHRCIDDPETWIENRIHACRDLAALYCKRDETDHALAALTRSFTLGAPRAEICCELGRIFQQREDYLCAIFWYRAAPTCAPGDAGGGFALPECSGYIPYLQLCVCHGKLGQYELAEEYNEKAAVFKPGDPAVENNRVFFENRRAGRNFEPKT
ncbi:MAG: glycosyltransferase family 2 protein [Oscillospiraceae bacterium]|jgi:glycosyltransferase involved in cell wall biosynthesis|nr:glycosyltransferase family 2 protein [Oscillospiraceae bacterium]